MDEKGVDQNLLCSQNCFEPVSSQLQKHLASLTLCGCVAKGCLSQRLMLFLMTDKA